MVFVAINKIYCVDSYCDQFEANFKSRTRAVDNRPGFIAMVVLRPKSNGEPYLVISKWENETAFIEWTKSDDFAEGHKRARSEMQAFLDRGEIPPLKSSLSTYEVMT